MRLLHTSDWHLGHTLHDVPRDHEHARFLAWLGDTLEQEEVDALVVAGDVFDTANPPASAQARWYGFLADIRQRMPALDVVVIGGNHDSAARLDAPTPLLQAMRIHVIGAIQRRPGPGSRLDLERLLVPLTDRSGDVAAVMAAVPFLRPSDLPRPPAGAGDDPGAPSREPLRDPLIWGVRQIYAEVLAAARARLAPGQALLAAGHCYMVGTDLSRLSERRILGGNQHALPVSIFPDDVAYVALGHLHKAQRVGGRDGVRYAGSPLPLALNEAGYRHQVCLVDLDGPALAGVRSVPVPRAVDVLRVPRRGTASKEDVLAALAALEDWDGISSSDTRPFLEVCVALSRPEPRLRHEVEQALQNKRPRLVKLSVEYTGDGAPLAEALPARELRELDPMEVFQQRYLRDHGAPPPGDLREAFDGLLEQVLARRGASRRALPDEERS